MPHTVSNVAASGAEPAACSAAACCTRLLELAGQAQGFFYGCYNQRIHSVVCDSLTCALAIVQNRTVQCRNCMKHIYDCYNTIQLKQ